MGINNKKYLDQSFHGGYHVEVGRYMKYRQYFSDLSWPLHPWLHP